MTPPVCCALSQKEKLGEYGDMFGAPEFELEVKDGKVISIKVLRGAPCGATWTAAEKVTGLPLDEAATRIGLETQFMCSADPSNWDVIYGKSPVHVAGEMHKTALKKSLKKTGTEIT